MSGDVLLADEGAADREERFVDVGAPVVAAGKAAVVVQPGEGALHDPALGSEPGAVLAGALGGTALGDLGHDSAGAQLGAVTLGVIRTVGEQRLRTELAVRADGRDAVDEVGQLGDVVAIGRGQRRRERDPVARADQVVLAAFAAAVDWRGPGLLAPPLARTCELSTTARDQSISPASCSSSSSTWCSRFHTPAWFHSANRRQHVIPDPQPISCGRSSHGIPVFNTNKIPVRTRRSGIRLRPGYRDRRLTTGNSGCTRAHNSSDTRGFAIATDFAAACQNPHFVRGPLRLGLEYC